MANKDVVIRISATDAAGPTFRKIAAEAKSMGAEVTTAADSADRSLEQVGKRGAMVGAAIGTALGGAALLLGEFGRAAAEEEAVFARLEQSVTNTGRSFDEYAARIQKAIAAGQALAFSDDQVADALARLNGYTNDTDASLNQMALTMDLARMKGIDLGTAADIIGKVYGGNTAILSRYGIQVKEGATATEALAQIQQRAAGQAEAYGETQAASIDRAKNSLDDFTESLGAHAGQLATLVAILPGVTAGWSLVAGAFGGITGALGAGGAAASGAGATGAMAGFGAAAATAATAALAFAPALAVIGYTAYTAKDNIEAVTERTDALTESLKRVNAAAVEAGTAVGGVGTTPGVDEYATKLYGMVSQYSSNAEYTDEFGNTYTLESVFDELTALKGVYQDAFLDMARSMQIDFAAPSAESIQLLIDQILYFNRLQRSVMYEQELTDYQAMGNPQFNLSTTAGGKYYADTGGTQYTGPGATPYYINGMPGGSFNQINKPQPRYYGDVNTGYDGPLSDPSNRTVMVNLPKETTVAPRPMADSATYSTDAVDAYNAALQEQFGAYTGLVQGINNANDAQSAFKATQDGLIQSGNVYGQQVSEYTSQLNAQESAYDILAKRQEEGIALTQEQTSFMENYAKATELGTSSAEDATLQQGYLAQQYLLNIENGRAMNEALGAQTGSVNDLVTVIENLILAMEGVPDSVVTEIELRRADEALAALQSATAYLNALDGRSVTFYVNAQGNGISVGNPNGPSITSDLTGMNGLTMNAYAAGGTVYGGNHALVGERGPELVWLPNGSQVMNTEGSKSRMSKGRRGGGDIVNYGPINLQPASTDVYGALSSQLMGGVR